MSLYQFLPKTLIGTYKSAMNLSPGTTIFYSIFYVFYFCAIAKWVGSFAAVMSVLLASGAILILEIINYIEHYGLRRKLLPDGTY